MNKIAEPIIALEKVTKRFGGVAALEDVSVSVRPGEVHCLLGDNGAGKSTLIKILSGYHTPTAGRILWQGKPEDIPSPREARALGIATVHQDVGSIPLMSVGRNFFLGAEPLKQLGPLKIYDATKANRIAVEQIRGFGITRVSSGDQLVGTLSGGERQVLAIARAMYFGAKVLILDEPTSALGVKEAAKVLTMVKHASARGVAVIFITHNARHAMMVGHTFTVLARGVVLASFRAGEKSRDEVLALMAGGAEANAELEADLAGFEDDADSTETRR